MYATQLPPGLEKKEKRWGFQGSIWSLDELEYG